LLAYRLNAVHNLFYYHALVRDIRQALSEGSMDQFAREFLSPRGDNSEDEGGENVC